MDFLSVPEQLITSLQANTAMTDDNGTALRTAMVAPPCFQFASIKDVKPKGDDIYKTVHVTELKASLHIGSIVLLSDDETSWPLMIACIIDVQMIEYHLIK
jgi:hypothetical protein